MKLSMYGVTPNYVARKDNGRRMVNVDIELGADAYITKTDGVTHIVLFPEDALALATTIMEVIPHETVLVEAGDENE